MKSNIKRKINKKKTKRIAIITTTIILLLAVIITTLFVCAKSCTRSDKKYDYNMSDYISIPSGYKGYGVEIELNSIQAAIDSYLMDYATEYEVKRGDNVYVDIVANEVDIFTGADGTIIDKRGDEIPELAEKGLLIENIGNGSYAQRVEASIIGTKVGVKTRLQITLPDSFRVEEWAGKEVFIDVTVSSKQSKLGDVVGVAYTGYLLNQETLERIPNTDKKDDKENDYKTFDTSSSAKFYLGSHLAIDGFEENIVGMLIGETKTFKADFPDDYSNEQVRGQTVEFEVTLKTIYVPPVYNDKFVKDYYDYETTEEFETALKDRYILASVYEYIVKNSTVHSYPKAEYGDAERELEEISETFLDTYNITLDEYILKTFGSTREEYIKDNMKSEMIYYTIGRANGIEPNQEQLLDEKESLVEYYKNYYMSDGIDEASAKTKANDFVNRLGDDYVYENVLFQLVDAWLVENAAVTEKPIPEGMESITIQISKDNEAQTK